MARPIVASSMLKTAYKLAGQQAGPGRPALSDLRRATSTAYYALFHQLTRHAARAAFPGIGEVEIAQVARWHTHKGVHEASRLVIAAAGSKPSQRAGIDVLRPGGQGPPVELQRVAQAFVDLQDARHTADYSHDYDPVRYVTLRHVEMADQALKRTWSMWRASASTKPARLELHHAYRRFLQLASLESGGPKNRS